MRALAADPVLLASREVFSHPRVSLAVERFATGDGEIERPVLRMPRCAAILAQPTPETVVLVRQWRYAMRRWTWEIPAGTCEPGEDPASCARRELAEEAGFAPSSLAVLLRYVPEHGIGDEEVVLFRAGGLSPRPTRPDPGELCTPAIVRVGELPGMLRAGEITDAKTLFALVLLGIDLRSQPLTPSGGGSARLPCR